MKIFDTTSNTIIAHNARLADTVISRMVGLLNRRSLCEGEALVITRCNSIHMFFMRFAIDVVFVGRTNNVVGLIKKIQPFRLSPIFWKAVYAIELPAGTIEDKNILIGDRIQLV